MSKARKSSPPFVRISKFCCNQGCRRVGVTANKVSDFWVVRCEQCAALPAGITLDFGKIPSAEGRRRRLELDEMD